MYLKGNVVVDEKTKNIISRINPNQIAIINHPDLDELAARALLKAKVKAVVNAGKFITGKYPNYGPSLLIENGVVLVDETGMDILNLKDNDEIIIDLKSGALRINDTVIGKGNVLEPLIIEKLLEQSHKNINNELKKFVDNTFEFATKEKEIIYNDISFPDLQTKLVKKHVVIVVRGKYYKEDLLAIKSYINEKNPVLIGVDGGADALLELGYKPHIVIGDMDSISEKALMASNEIIVHAYLNGNAPGKNRLHDMNLEYISLPSPGTSEDAALLLAYAKKAELIVIVGAHSNMIDFLEKGRQGMASTFLVRVKIGSKLVDAKGVNKLYNTKFNFKQIFPLLSAGIVPFLIITSIYPFFNNFWRIIFLKIRMLVSF